MIKEILTSPMAFIFFILIIIIISLIIIIVQPNKKKRNFDQKDPLPKNYFQKVPVWGDIKPEDIKIFDNKGSFSDISGTSICSLYTYQNEFDIGGKISLNSLFEDYDKGLVKRVGTVAPICLDSNQLLAYHGKHTCINKNNGCINKFGNFTNFGTSEESTFNCGVNIPSCKGTIYNVSLNFELTPGESLNTNSKFLGISSLSVSSKRYRQLETENNYYFQQGLFREDKNITNENLYIPDFYNDQYKSNSYRQQLKFNRYVFDDDSLTYEENSKGLFAEIIYSPINAYLTSNLVNGEYQLQFLSFGTTDYTKRINWVLMPELDLDPRKIPTDNKYIKGNLKNLSSDATIYGPTTPSSSSPYSNEQYKNYFSINSFLPPYKLIKKNDTIVSLRSTGSITATNGNPNIGSLTAPLSVTVNMENLSDPTRSRAYPSYAFRAQNYGAGDPQKDINGASIGITRDFTDRNNNSSSVLSETNRYLLYKPTKDDKDGLSYYLSQNENETINFVINTTDNDFAEGDIIKDGEVLWEVLDTNSLVTSFAPSYFTSSVGLSGASEVTFNKTNTNSKYTKIKENIVSRINYSRINYNNNLVKPGTYSINLDNIDTDIPITNFNPDNIAVLDLVFIPVDTARGKGVAIQSFIISEPGDSYINGQNFEIKGSAFGSNNTSNITGLQLQTSNQEVIFEAVPMDSSNNVININKSTSDNIKVGLILDNEDVIITNNKITGIGKIKQEGQGYNIGDIIYINQLDNQGNSLMGEEFNPENINNKNVGNLASIKVENLSSSGTSFNTPANYDLKRNTKGGTGNIALTNDDIKYEFWSNSQGRYNNSPPQIAYGGDGLINLLINNGVKSGKDLLGFFNSNKIPGTFLTSLDNIKTLQFRELNYIGRKDTISPGSVNTLSSFSQPVLGRFIPYSIFSHRDNIFYNNNRTQLVPYGLNNIYSRAFSSDTLPQL
jgi:hypothetical protein